MPGPRKAFSDLSPAQQHRIELTARKLGVSVSEVRSNPQYAKAARGHSRSEGHADRPQPAQDITRRGAPAKQVGKSVTGIGSYKGGATPTGRDVRNAIAAMRKGSEVIVYAQVVSSKASPGRKYDPKMVDQKPGETSGRVVDWIAVGWRRDSLLKRLDDNNASAMTGEQIAQFLYHPERPFIAALAWQIQEVQERNG